MQKNTAELLRPANALVVNQQLFKMIHLARMNELKKMAAEFQPEKEDPSETRTLLSQKSI